MAPTSKRRVMAVSDAAALARTAAERLIARIATSSGRVAICLTGGSSPRQLYELLGSEAFRNQIPWQRVHWFITDERFVPVDDPLNNMRMARKIFLDRRAPIENIHPIPTEPDPGTAARLYEDELKSFYGTNTLDPARPLFELVLMGLGPDGHTASLFPDYPALDETERWVTGVPTAHVEPFVPRVTLTLPTLNCCREMLFEVAGAEKRDILVRVLEDDKLPAARAHALGETLWLVERTAMPENFHEF